MIEIIKTKARYMVSIETHMIVLWWRNSNTKDNVIDSKMCVHVFFGNFSSSYSNYALRCTAVDNEK